MTLLLKPESRDALLSAIGKARGWIDDIRLGRIASFAGIAQRQWASAAPGLCEIAQHLIGFHLYAGQDFVEV